VQKKRRILSSSLPHAVLIMRLSTWVAVLAAVLLAAPMAAAQSCSGPPQGAKVACENPIFALPAVKKGTKVYLVGGGKDSADLYCK
jgi:hypothetical protein